MPAMAGTAGAATPPGSAAAAPPLPPPRRRRSPLATAARALALLVLVVVAAGSGIGAGLLVAGSVGAGPGGSPPPSGAAAATAAPTERPTPTPTPSPTPTPTPSPTPTPEPTPRLGTPEDVARLRAWLPRALRNDCTSASLRSRDELAALRCTAKDVQLVRYVLFGSADRMSARWDAFVAQAEISPDGRCAMGEEAAGTWGDEGIFGIFGETRGSLACTVEPDGQARVDWTTVDAPIWGTLWRDDEDIAAAYATWSEGKLNLLREPR